MKEGLISLLNNFGIACWIEVSTEQPKCTYYFGPFLTKAEALDAQAGYVEDLKSEGATNIQVKIKRCKPRELTIVDELAEQGYQFNGIVKAAGQLY